MSKSVVMRHCAQCGEFSPAIATYTICDKCMSNMADIMRTVDEPKFVRISAPKFKSERQKKIERIDGLCFKYSIEQIRSL